MPKHKHYNLFHLLQSTYIKNMSKKHYKLFIVIHNETVNSRVIIRHG